MRGRGPILGGRGPPMWALFSENERIGSRRGGGHAPENFACRFTNAFNYPQATIQDGMIIYNKQSKIKMMN